MKLKSINKKIRGLKRKQKYIDNWVELNKELDLDYLMNQKYDYRKLWIYPFNQLRICNVNTVRKMIVPQRVKNRIFNEMLHMLSDWNQKLSHLNEPYYLKIWLFEPNFMDSQIVVAIGDRAEYYERIFNKSILLRKHRLHQYGLEPDIMDQLDIEQFNAEYLVFDDELEDNSDYKRYITRKIGKSVTVTEINDQKTYVVNTGIVWCISIK